MGCPHKLSVVKNRFVHENTTQITVLRTHIQQVRDVVFFNLHIENPPRIKNTPPVLGLTCSNTHSLL